MFYKIIFLVTLHFLRVLSFFFYRTNFFFKSPKLDVLYLAAFYPENAGFYYRIHVWKNFLQKAGYTVDVLYASYPNSKNQDIHYYLVKVMLKRFSQVLRAINYKLVIVRRELLPNNDYGSFFLEKLLKKVNTNLILDFDDNISESKNEPRNTYSIFSKLALESKLKFSDSLSYYKHFIVATTYLRNFFNLSEIEATIIPTCIDYNSSKIKNYDHLSQSSEVVLGWIGSNNNQKYLRLIIKQIDQVARYHRLKLIVISGKEFKAKVKNVVIENIKWSLKTEQQFLLKIDIGLMPLPDNGITRGKAAFKLIQYMGLGIVSIASAITENKEIIEEAENGFLLEKEVDMEEKLLEVLSKKKVFKFIGQKAFETINKRYSVKANEDKYLAMIKRNLIKEI